MRKLLIIIAFIAPLFTAGVVYANPALPGVDESTRSFLESGFVSSTHGGRVFTAYRPLGFERSGNRLYGYVWGYSQEYFVEAGRLQPGQTFSSPLVLIYEQQGGVYRVVMHQQPAGGSFFAASVRNIFPAQYHDAIFSRRGISELATSAESQAKAYFGVGAIPVQIFPL